MLSILENFISRSVLNQSKYHHLKVLKKVQANVWKILVVFWGSPQKHCNPQFPFGYSTLSTGIYLFMLLPNISEGNIRTKHTYIKFRICFSSLRTMECGTAKLNTNRHKGEERRKYDFAISSTTLFTYMFLLWWWLNNLLTWV